MSLWRDLAAPHLTSAHGGPMAEVRGLVLHIAEGYYQGTIDYQHNPANNVSSHFVVSNGAKGQGRDGDIAQCVDTGLTAWTQRAGNGHWLSVENAGFTPHPLTAAQIEACARLFARGHLEYGYPLQLANSPDGRGLGYHSMGHHPGFDDDWGHGDCPGPAIIAQRPTILARAIQIVNGDDMPTADELVKALLSAKLGSSGPTVGVALQATYQRVMAALPADLVGRLDGILVAAQDDGDVTVQLPPEGLAALQAIRDRVAALPDTAELRDALADLGEGGAAAVRADA